MLFFEDKLVMRMDEAEQQWPLLASTRVSLRYQGFRHESLGGRMHASGIDNFIQVDDGPEYAFAVPNEAIQATLRRELRHWYERKVQLREFRWGNRTIFLYKEPSYEQLQAFKKEFGISLYR
ncbi:MAG: hypothetical protein ACRYF0_13575 [Janthinobacterium lividum]